MLPLYIAVGVLLLLSIILIVWNIRTEQRLRKFFDGSNANSLEKTISKLLTQVDLHSNHIESIHDQLQKVTESLHRPIRSITTRRYSAFDDGTGRQSFTICLVSDTGDGVIISSLYARERNSLYAKKITKGKTEHELTPEEDAALQEALKQKTI